MFSDWHRLVSALVLSEWYVARLLREAQVTSSLTHVSPGDRRIRRQNMKRLFPSKKRPFQEHPFHLVKIELEQSGAGQRALMQFANERRHVLYMASPWAVSASTKIVHRQKTPFTWACDASLRHLVLVTAKQFLVFLRHRQTGWELVQRLPHDAPAQTQHWSIAMDHQALTVVAAHESGLLVLHRSTAESPTFVCQRTYMSSVKARFQLFPHSLQDNLLLAASPYFRATNGVVDLYHFPDHQLQELALCETLVPEMQAGFFGAHCAITPKPLLLISSPFLGKPFPGAGGVFVYRRWRGAWQLHQTLLHPTPLTRAQYAVLNFGRTFDVSVDGRWLAVGAFAGGHGQVYLYQFLRGRYKLLHILTRHNPKARRFGAFLSVDTDGSLIIGDLTTVYYAFRNHFGHVRECLLQDHHSVYSATPRSTSASTCHLVVHK